MILLTPFYGDSSFSASLSLLPHGIYSPLWEGEKEIQLIQVHVLLVAFGWRKLKKKHSPYMMCFNMVFFNPLQLLFFLMLKLSQFCWWESLQTSLCDSLAEHYLWKHPVFWHTKMSQVHLESFLPHIWIKFKRVIWGYDFKDVGSQTLSQFSGWSWMFIFWGKI